MNIDTITRHYAICALWSSTGEDQEPLDDTYGVDDISPETMQAMREDVASFVESNRELLEQSEQSEEQIGHDFWLTRNHHGAGFWDRGLGAVGDALTKASHVYGSVDLYVGDDGQVWA